MSLIFGCLGSHSGQLLWPSALRFFASFPPQLSHAKSQRRGRLSAGGGSPISFNEAQSTRMEVMTTFCVLRSANCASSCFVSVRIPFFFVSSSCQPGSACISSGSTQMARLNEPCIGCQMAFSIERLSTSGSSATSMPKESESSSASETRTVAGGRYSTSPSAWSHSQKGRSPRPKSNSSTSSSYCVSKNEKAAVGIKSSAAFSFSFLYTSAAMKRWRRLPRSSTSMLGRARRVI